MSIFTRDELKTLCQEREGGCISIYMSTHPRATETDQGRIQLKNLLAEAEKHLAAAGLRVSDAQKLLEPAYKFLWDNLFWRHQDEGLAETLVSAGPEKQLQFHTSSGPLGSGRRAAIFHGHSSA